MPSSNPNSIPRPTSWEYMSPEGIAAARKKMVDYAVDELMKMGKAMAAKINIETGDPALAAILGMVIAKAIEEAGFTNAMAKTVTISKTVTGFNKVSELNAQAQPEVGAGEEIRNPPELNPLRWCIPTPDQDLLKLVAERNPGVLNKPVLLSFCPDTSPAYEKAAAEFLTGQGVYRRPVENTEAEWDMDKINALPEMKLPNENDLAVLSGIVEEGPLRGSDSQKESIQKLVEMGFLVEVICDREDGSYAATPAGAAYYLEFFNYTTIMDGVVKRIKDSQASSRS